MKNQPVENHWISLSDIMTGLMVVFLFVSVAYMSEIQKKQAERDIMFEEFKASKEQLYTELDSVFNEDFKQWKVELDKDLSIKFTNPEVLFASGKSELRQEFRQILDKFFPKYLAIVTQEKYKDKIAEIRIEGHTDPEPIVRKLYKNSMLVQDSTQKDSLQLPKNIQKVSPTQLDELDDAYIGNVQLSQDRARSVLKYIRNLNEYRELPNEQKALLQFWITANGLSYGRTLDNNKKLSFETGETINNENSRRVEFRIVTTSEKLVEKVIKQLQ